MTHSMYCIAAGITEWDSCADIGINAKEIKGKNPDFMRIWTASVVVCGAQCVLGIYSKWICGDGGDDTIKSMKCAWVERSRSPCIIASWNYHKVKTVESVRFRINARKPTKTLRWSYIFMFITRWMNIAINILIV